MLGQQSGVEQVALAGGQVGSHAHALKGAATTTTPTPGSTVVLGTTNATDPIYATAGTGAVLTTAAVASTGGGLAHENRQPSLAVTYIISLFGVYPTQN